MPSELNIKEWLKRANDDELAAKILLREGPPSYACFHSQQMAEKYLKSFLIAKKGEFPKIHQLDLLLKLCIDIDSAFEELKTEVILLNDYYVDTRYPGDYPEFTVNECQKAFKAAQKIKEFIINKISPNTQPAKTSP